MQTKNQSPTTGRLIGCLILIVLTFLAGGGIAVLANQIPDVAAQLPPNAGPIIVTLTTPLNEEIIPQNQATTITAEAVGGNPIATLELWIDGTVAQSKNAPSGDLKQFSAFWTWMPASAGEHILLVRATDTQQNVGQSNVVRVTASKDANPTVEVTYQPKPGETVKSVADKFKTTPEQILDLNPQLNPNNPLPSDPISVPVPLPPAGPPSGPNSPPPPPPPTPTPEPPAPPEGPAQPPPANPPNKNLFWFAKYISNLLAQKPPAAPEISAKADGCNVNLFLSDKAKDESGFFVYRFEAGAPDFVRIATLDANNGALPIKYVDTGLIGATVYLYYVSSFNVKGESPSNVVKVIVMDKNCVGSQGPGFELNKGKIEVSQPVDKIYCYVSINGGMWSRIPPVPNTFIYPDKQNKFDVSKFINTLQVDPQAKTTIELECWGWKGNTLIYLGKAQKTIGPSDPIGPVKFTGEKFQLAGDLKFNPATCFNCPHPALAPPTGLKSTGNPTVCSEHMAKGLGQLIAALICGEAIKSQYVVLVWDWEPWPLFCPPQSPPGCVPIADITGFRVYKDDYPTPALVKEVQGADLTTTAFPWPPKPWGLPANATPAQKAKYAAQSSNCYTVRAFKKDAGESAASNKFCLKALETTTGITTVKIPASSRLTRYIYEYKNCSAEAGTGSSKEHEPAAGEITVGYDNSTYKCDYNDVVFRGAVWFDLSAIPKKVPVPSATLEYDYKAGWYWADGDLFPTAAMSCARQLMLGTDAWMGKDYGNAKYWIPGEPYLDFDPVNVSDPKSKHFTRNVTSAVKEWLQGSRANYGFVFRNTWEKTDAETNEDCWTRYGNFTLSVTYFPNP